jgi:hypothetical protein
VTTFCLPSENLSKALNFFDRIIGSQEKRQLVLFSQKGLYLAGGDDFLNAFLMLKTNVHLPHLYTFSLDPLRSFLKDKLDKNIKVELSSSLKFIMPNEELALKIQPTSLSFAPNRGKTLGIIPIQTLKKILDLASVISQEGEKISFFFQKAHLGALSENHGVISCAFTPLPSSLTLSFTMPYTPSRHLVNALDFISEKQASLFLTSQALQILLPNLKISLRLISGKTNTFSLLKSLLTTQPLAKLKIGFPAFKKTLSRLARVQKQLNATGSITLMPEKCVFKIAAFQGSYSFILPLETSLNQSFTINCHFSFLNSLFMRIKGKEFSVSILPSGWLLKHGQYFCFLRKN